MRSLGKVDVKGTHDGPLEGILYRLEQGIHYQQGSLRPDPDSVFPRVALNIGARGFVSP
jgi:hypothetical protein